MTARIYRPARTAMQSGKAKTRDWILEFEAESPREIEPLMGYTASRDTQGQVKLRFETKDAAVAYAKRNGIPYVLQEPHDSVVRPIAYADNFRFDRKGLWTH